MPVTSNVMQQLSAAIHNFRHADPWRALATLARSRSDYVALAMSHGMAVNLEKPDLRKLHTEGAFPRPGWEGEAREDATRAMHSLLSALLNSFLALTVVAIAAIVVLLLRGAIAPDLPVSWPKVLGTAGAFLAGWATLFELGGLSETWSGRSLNEMVHPKIFTALFVPGAFLAFLGQLW